MNTFQRKWSWVWWTQFQPLGYRSRQISEFEASLVYIGSCRLGRIRDTLSPKAKETESARWYSRKRGPNLMIILSPQNLPLHKNGSLTMYIHAFSVQMHDNKYCRKEQQSWREIAESAKCLLYTHEDLSSVSVTDVKKLGLCLCS